MNKKMKMGLYIPYNIDLDAMLKEDPIDVANAKDYLIYILNLIHYFPAYYKDSISEDEHGFTTISSKYLQSRVDNYKRLVDWTVKNGVIEVNNSYHVNAKRTKGYRFTVKYNTEVKEVFIKTKTLIKRIINREKEFKQDTLRLEHIDDATPYEIHNYINYSGIMENRLIHLNKWFNDQLEIDVSSSLDYLHKLYANMELDTSIVNPMKKLNCWKIGLSALSSSYYRFKVDNKTGRLHTCLTNLKSDLRHFLSYGGNSLASADIKNSQPLLSLTLLDETLFVKNGMLKRIQIYNDRFLSSEKENNPYILLGNLIRQNSKKPDALRYKELVITGKLYEEFGKVIKSAGLVSQDISGQELRKFTKKQVLKCLFNYNQAIGTSKYQQLFKKEFPSVYEVFSAIKFNQHNTLACVLQNLEAELVLHKACKEISQVIPNAPIFTIHDSIATTGEYISIVSSILRKHVDSAVGQAVQIKEEYLSKDLLNSLEGYRRGKIANRRNFKVGDGVYDIYQYGYCDPTTLYFDYYNTLSDVAKLLNLNRRRFFEGLRKLNVLCGFNLLPGKELIDEGLFIVEDFTKKVKTRRGIKSISLTSIKVTDKGITFLRDITLENQELFPVRKKKGVRK